MKKKDKNRTPEPEEKLTEELAVEKTEPSEEETPETPKKSRKKGLLIAVLIICAVLAAALIAAALYLRNRNKPKPAPAQPSETSTLPRETAAATEPVPSEEETEPETTEPLPAETMPEYVPKTDEPVPEQGQYIDNTLFVAAGTMSGDFSPLFCTAGPDSTVARMLTQAYLFGTDAKGNVVADGIDGPLTGLAKLTTARDAAGNTVYTVSLRKNVLFSDGTPLTADDVLFTLYVLCDPSYDGSFTFAGLPVAGLKEYREEMISLSDLILEAGRDYQPSSCFTKDEYDFYWESVDAAGMKLLPGIVDYWQQKADEEAAKEENPVEEDGGEEPEEVTLTGALEKLGITCEEDASDADCWKAIWEHCGSFEEISALEGVDVDFKKSVDEELGNSAADYGARTENEKSVNTVSGIAKIDDYTVSITVTEADPAAVRALCIPVVPMHCYGDTDFFDISAGHFGFRKGDLSAVRSVTVPVGAGPYCYLGFEQGTVTMEANALYFRGKPKIEYLKLTGMPEGTVAEAILNGTADITADASVTDALLDSVREINSNGELTGDTVTTVLYSENTYGYIGLNAERVKVGDADSPASKNLRRGFATLLAFYREAALGEYYGTCAKLVNVPLKDAPAGRSGAIYGITGDGTNIYETGYTEQAALDAAVGFFRNAGYVWDEESSSFTAAPEGGSMAYTAMVPGGGTGAHPAYAVFTKASAALEKIGITLIVRDLEDTAVLWDALNDGTAEIWAAAESGSDDGAMFERYRSGGARNRFGIRDPLLDEALSAASKPDYNECFETVMGWGCEVPFYRRQGAVLYSTGRLNGETVPANIGANRSWMDDIEQLEMQLAAE